MCRATWVGFSFCGFDCSVICFNCFRVCDLLFGVVVVILLYCWVLFVLFVICCFGIDFLLGVLVGICGCGLLISWVCILVIDTLIFCGWLCYFVCGFSVSFVALMYMLLRCLFAGFAGFVLHDALCGLGFCLLFVVWRALFGFGIILLGFFWFMVLCCFMDDFMFACWCDTCYGVFTCLVIGLLLLWILVEPFKWFMWCLLLWFEFGVCLLWFGFMVVGLWFVFLYVCRLRCIMLGYVLLLCACLFLVERGLSLWLRMMCGFGWFVLFTLGCFYCWRVFLFWGCLVRNLLFSCVCGVDII